jgi:hypothetical protein
MRTAKLHIVRVGEHPRQLHWARGLHVAGLVLWWLLTFVWGLTKAIVIVLAFMLGLVLVVIGVLGHFVGGPPR